MSAPTIVAMRPDTTARKRREVLRREAALVDIAVKIAETEGFHSLTLGRVAQAAEYSKGTLYNHFTCREDLLMRMCVEFLSGQIERLRAVAAHPWNPGERPFALALGYLLHAAQVPTLFECAITCNTTAVRTRASDERVNARDTLDLQISTEVIEWLSSDTGAVDSLAERADALRCYLFGHSAVHLLAPSIWWNPSNAVEHINYGQLPQVMIGLGFPVASAQREDEVFRSVEAILQTAK